ncbi:16S rRNA (adenine(1518)-N(6)/adenine(1519)-N(6))-dimethyltransferase RsmA [Sedimentibacter sp. zth1]|uniref:16S rRNA (adenine(1518)-N(6)/adenine(1519)-N(6))- dimethyltransferase RsmA n=1 Tax=Sedimentibacter sp. zth1 TaxID=2816908 RepID=UPI001A9352A7|nr:16S rRNA (adenine(1518)-N(6)/adenine(1519)-N(6))-dimethyltransferase RsmA [Sedimentibacter sp. zth1]QSX04762.1 16S rRNA (adenine(1518)-N(6)/adenine(1519)-N(6))-dimethyltransferase RsmA [Sedimentibacter sp. zth1]
MDEKKLYSPRIMKEILNRHGFEFSKSLGQNFLIDGNIINKIVDAAGIDDNTGVIEIGPGFGTLTQGLCNKAKKVIAIEIDKSLKDVHFETLCYDNLKIIYDDFMKVDVNRLIEEEFKGMKVKLVANLPYYITTPIIMKVLEDKINISGITVMVQKEVAQRLSAKPGNKDYGAISLAVQYRADAHISLIVPNTVFMPRPKVDSAVITIDILEKPRVEVKDEIALFAVIKAAFGQRRKTIHNSMSSNLKIEKEKVKNALENVNIDPGIRAEQLTIYDFAKIAEELYK